MKLSRSFSVSELEQKDRGARVMYGQRGVVEYGQFGLVTMGGSTGRFCENMKENSSWRRDGHLTASTRERIREYISIYLEKSRAAKKKRIREYLSIYLEKSRAAKKKEYENISQSTSRRAGRQKKKEYENISQSTWRRAGRPLPSSQPVCSRRTPCPC